MLDFKHYLAMLLLSAAFYLIPLLKYAVGFREKTTFNYFMVGVLFDEERPLPYRLARLLINLAIIWLILLFYELASGRRLPLDWLI